MNETEFKNLFKKSVAHHGGLAISLNSSFYTGLPDLYFLVPGFEAALCEAKFIKDVSTGKPFMRKIKYSELQISILDKANKLRHNAALGLIGWKEGKHVVAALVPGTQRHIDSVRALAKDTSYRGSFFNVPKMLVDLAEIQRQERLMNFDIDAMFGHEDQEGEPVETNDPHNQYT